ncbi:hypothetical protein CYLTODRAFT_495251 [Cylindrobasidium torrendii FP15055 ss-10]|uniref:JmjC domain-containing protein n=1 Tax=Cylindrobasidium torrendii FP15055 ss-10 TaxID=1314674 RepID=A0A0D7ASW0_9AGAR|nr:hypothetical protein CYLTODRAFT_495251 [Cylindrobasidium torrendii FP15055 ss-10]
MNNFKYHTIQISGSEKDTMKILAARYLAPLVRLESTTVANNINCILRPGELDTRYYCDACLTTLFFGSMSCRCCGWEFCLDCFVLFQTGVMPEVIRLPRQRSEMKPYACSSPSKHSSADFLYTTRFTLDALQATYMALAPWSEMTPPEVVSGPPGLTNPHGRLEAPYLSPGSEHLSSYLSNGIPVVVPGLRTGAMWSPGWFIEHYGRNRVMLINCETEEQTQSTVGKFFETFGLERDRSLPPLKLADWPPQTDFKTKFSVLYAEFCDILPFPEYMDQAGRKNIASYFAYNAQVPDLGPKMYIAHRTDTGNGSTRLHMDMSDAINILTYSSDMREGAVWDIFKREDAAKLHDFISQESGGSTAPNAIHAQGTYLSEDMLEKLAGLGVYGFRIRQMPGDAVIIPAGCAHQVANRADCIKVAADFVSPENISVCEGLRQEFRALNMHESWKEDALQISTMMWHAWMALQ